MAAFALPYRNAIQLAQDEINARAAEALGGRSSSFSAMTARRRATPCASRKSW